MFDSLLNKRELLMQALHVKLKTIQKYFLLGILLNDEKPQNFSASGW